MGEARWGQICRANKEATPRPSTKPLNSAKSQPLPNANSGHGYGTTNWESLFDANMPLGITSPTSAHPKPNSSLNWMDSLRSQHLEQEEYDQERTKYLESQGYKVIRFWNNNVLSNIEEVILAIIYAMENESHKK